jgi:hypothetical protein
MNTFKEGDKVVCIKDSDCAKMGETGVFEKRYIKLTRDDLLCDHLDFWEIVPPERTVITWENLKVGDKVKDKFDTETIIHICGPVIFTDTPDGDFYIKRVQNLKKNGYTIIQPTPPVQEMTVEEVSKLVGKTVKIVDKK